ncbi:MAG: PAS domain S-box protein [Acaryochloridaceae cyanobacterium RU_4_10]|nr:PAS domain S-box protein [Acaryochloridaceae cyanobacterium RU_4_10]
MLTAANSSLTLLSAKGAVTGFVSQVRTYAGESIWIVENAHRVCDDGGQLLYYEGTVQDITDRKDTEAILQRQLSASEAASEGIAILTKNGFYLCQSCPYSFVWLRLVQ